METVLSICLGLGLAAACGFRVFVPLLMASIAARAGHLQVASGFEWLGSDAALVSLGVATVLEIGAYFIPWLDNLLDTVAMPAAVVAGTLVTASAVGEVSPLMQWSLAVIAGGGIAGSVQAATTVARGFSSATTLGFGNPAFALAEATGAAAVSVVAILIPVLAAAMVATVVVALVILLIRSRSRQQRVAA